MSVSGSSLLEHPVLEKHDILCELIGAVLGPEQAQRQRSTSSGTAIGPTSPPVSDGGAKTLDTAGDDATAPSCSSFNTQSSSSLPPATSTSSTASTSSLSSPSTTLVLLCLQACTHGARTRPMLASSDSTRRRGQPQPLWSVLDSGLDADPGDGTESPPSCTPPLVSSPTATVSDTGEEADSTCTSITAPSTHSSSTTAYELTRRFLLECDVEDRAILERPLHAAVALQQWLSVQLDEKRLSTTLEAAYRQADVARCYYHPCALLLCEQDRACLCSILRALEERVDAPSPVAIVARKFNPQAPIVFARNHARLRFVATANLSRRDSHAAVALQHLRRKREDVSTTTNDYGGTHNNTRGHAGTDTTKHTTAIKHTTATTTTKHTATTTTSSSSSSAPKRSQHKSAHSTVSSTSSSSTTSSATAAGVSTCVVDAKATDGTRLTSAANDGVKEDQQGRQSRKQQQQGRQQQHEEVEEGYLCVQIPMTSPTAVPAHVDEAEESAFETLEVVWTPNVELLPLTHPSRLPPGWDSAYDPVTGHNYYINKQTRITTWTHPLANEPTPTDAVALELRPTHPFDVYFVVSDSGEDTGIVALLGHPSGLASSRAASVSGRAAMLSRARTAAAATTTTTTTTTTTSSSSSNNNNNNNNSSSSSSSRDGGGDGNDGSGYSGDDDDGGGGVLRADDGVEFDAGCTSPQRHTFASVLRDAQTRTEALVLELPLFQLQTLAHTLTKCRACHVRQVLPDWDMNVNTKELQRAIFAERHARRSADIGFQYACAWSRQFEADDDAQEGRVTSDVLRSYLTEDGRFSEFDAFRKLLFFKPLSWTVRQQVWPFLLDVFTPWSTAEQRRRIYRRKRDQYAARKLAWTSVADCDASHVRHVVRDIVKDAARTDRGFAMFEGANNVWLEAMVDILATWTLDAPNRSYSQGMSDLLAPILAVVQDEALAFWCFDALMHRDANVFDELGLRMSQVLADLQALVRYAIPELHDYLCHRDVVTMLFCYRWLLLSFKREFSMQETMMLWDLMWSQYRTRDFPVFVAAAVLKVTAPALMAADRPPDQVLEFYTRLAGTLDVTKVIATARQILYQLRHDPDRPQHLDHLVSLPHHRIRKSDRHTPS